jgi:cyclophilin family peptidyl-prolyl cis-trans isomerase
MRNKFLVIALGLLLLNSCKKNTDLPDGLYADIQTNKGNIIVKLDYQKAPITVSNFVSLAEGKNIYVKNEGKKGKPFYDGLKFHRVIPEFMIQGGDPLGTGMGDPGYRFKDEFSDLKFNKGGLLAMANSGPATNGSQFFITHVATPWLDNKHTIFGEVIANGMEIVNSIVQDDVIEKVTIIRIGEAAKKFKSSNLFNDYYANEAKNQSKKLAEAEKLKVELEGKLKENLATKIAFFETEKAKAKKTKSGLKYSITEKGNGKKPKKGTPIYIHYAGFLENGTLFDTSIETTAMAFGKFDQRRADANQYLPIPFEAGRKDGMIPGFIEGLEQLSFNDKAILFIPSELAYGAGGAGDVIPPNANIIFEVQLLEEMPKQ